MSNFLNDEQVPPVKPLSTAMLEDIANEVLAELLPEALFRPTAIDIAEWADTKLEKYGISVAPATANELGPRLGATDPVDAGDGITQILLEADHYDTLFSPGRQANRARATLLHELSHSILHVPLFRRRMKTPDGAKILLSRMVRRDTLQAFRDPEWQAWTLAGCIAAPRCAIDLTGTRDPATLADIFRMSPAFMESHLKRLWPPKKRGQRM